MPSAASPPPIRSPETRRDAARLFAHLRERLLVELEIELRDEAKPAHDAQRILCEAARRDRAQHAALQVFAAFERIDDRAVGKPLRHRVDREVAAAEILGHRRRRVDDDVEVVPARTRRHLAARRRDLDAGLRALADRPVGRVEAHADGPVCDDQLLGTPVRRQQLSQARDVDAGHEEVCVLRVATEQLVSHRAADDVGVEAERADVLLDLLQRSAIASISTSAPDGSFATSTVDRAGGRSPTCDA